MTSVLIPLVQPCESGLHASVFCCVLAVENQPRRVRGIEIGFASVFGDREGGRVPPVHKQLPVTAKREFADVRLVNHRFQGLLLVVEPAV